jgi:hypothetical protein
MLAELDAERKPELVEFYRATLPGDKFLFLSSFGYQILCPMKSSSFRITGPDTSILEA